MVHLMIKLLTVKILANQVKNFQFKLALVLRFMTCVLQLCRVSAMRKALVDVLGSETFNEERIWCRRRLILWCRKHAFTPLDTGTLFYFNMNIFMLRVLYFTIMYNIEGHPSTFGGKTVRESNISASV